MVSPISSCTSSLSSKCYLFVLYFQLQDMVKEMKMGFSTALEALVQIQMGDQVLQERVNNNKMEHDNQLADVLNMVLSLKVGPFISCTNKCIHTKSPSVEICYCILVSDESYK